MNEQLSNITKNKIELPQGSLHLELTDTDGAIFSDSENNKWYFDFKQTKWKHWEMSDTTGYHRQFSQYDFIEENHPQYFDRIEKAQNYAMLLHLADIVKHLEVVQKGRLKFKEESPEVNHLLERFKDIIKLYEDWKVTSDERIEKKMLQNLSSLYKDYYTWQASLESGDEQGQIGIKEDSQSLDE